MRRIKVFEMKSAYRTPFVVTGYRFGAGGKAVAIVGGIRGNEVQQMFTCSQIVRKLKEIEEQGKIRKGMSVEVIPCLNPYSVNVGTRFWAMDGTDINRMFPGYDKGETTQRIAAGLFSHLQGWEMGIHFASYYIRGDFMAHTRVMETAFADIEGAADFGLPFVFIREPSPIDTTTLNYNWPIWNTRAYSILTGATDRINVTAARASLNAVLRFLAKRGVINYKVSGGYVPQTIRDSNLTTVHAPAAGFMRRILGAGEQAHKGQVLAEIIDPGEGCVLRSIKSPVDGIVFFACRDPLVMQRQTLFEIVTGLHGA